MIRRFMRWCIAHRRLWFIYNRAPMSWREKALVLDYDPVEYWLTLVDQDGEPVHWTPNGDKAEAGENDG